MSSAPAAAHAMPASRASFADAVLELSIAVVLIAVPLFVVPYSSLPFEEAKVGLLRSMALLCLPFLLSILARKHHDHVSPYDPDSKPLLAIAALVLLFGYMHLMSSIYGISPAESFFGTLNRRQGTYSTFCYLIFFCIVITTIRTHEQMDRLLLAVQLAGFVVSFWTLAQFLGIDPNLFFGFAKPTWSTFGNRLFLPAFLIMCVPINLYFVMRACTAMLSIGKTDASSQSQSRSKAFLSICLFFLVLNIFVIVMAQKRGPLLGLMVALLLFLLLLLLGRGRSRLALGLLCSSGLLALPTMFIALWGHRLAILSQLPFLQSLANSFQTGTGLVRVSIWKGIINTLASHPGRLLTGFGAETVSLATPSHMPPLLKQIERPTAIADRAHNEILDLILMHGALGTALFLAIFGFLGYVVLNYLGLIQSKNHKQAWPLSLLTGMLMGFLFPYFTTGQTAYCGMGTGLGLVSGMFIYLLYFTLAKPKRYRIRWDAKAVLLSLLLSALVAHFVEIQFSFGITATRLYYWVIAGMITMAGHFWEKRTGEDPRAEKNELIQLPPAIYIAILGCTASILASFAYLCFGNHHVFYIYSVLICQLSIVLVCCYFFKPHGAPVSGSGSLKPSQNTTPIFVMLGIGILYGVLLFMTEPVVSAVLNAFSNATLATVVAKNVRLIMTYAGIFTIIILGARSWVHLQGVHASSQERTAWLSVFMIILMLPPLVRSNLYYSIADIYTKAGDELVLKGNWQPAHQCFRSAIALEDRQARRHQKLGHFFFERAKLLAEPQKSRSYQEAINWVGASTHLAPRDVSLKNNLARMSSAWSADTQDENHRVHRLKLSAAFYEQALAADPNNTLLWKEAGQVSASLGQLEKAVKRFKHALQQQPNDFESHRNLALLYQAQERYAPALDHARTALRLAPKTEIYKIQALILKLQKQIQE